MAVPQLLLANLIRSALGSTAARLAATSTRRAVAASFLRAISTGELPQLSANAALAVLRRQGMGITRQTFLQLYRGIVDGGRQVADQILLPGDSPIPENMIPQRFKSSKRRFQYRFDVPTFDPETGDFRRRIVSVISDTNLTPEQALRQLGNMELKRYGQKVFDLNRAQFIGVFQRIHEFI